MKVKDENAICAVKDDNLVPLRFSCRVSRSSRKPRYVILEIVHRRVPVFQQLVTKELIGNERKLSSTVLKNRIKCIFASKEYRFSGARQFMQSINFKKEKKDLPGKILRFLFSENQAILDVQIHFR